MPFRAQIHPGGVINPVVFYINKIVLNFSSTLSGNLIISTNIYFC